jgi:hypothetical protein
MRNWAIPLASVARLSVQRALVRWFTRMALARGVADGQPKAANTREGPHRGHPRGDAHLPGKILKTMAHHNAAVTVEEDHTNALMVVQLRRPAMRVVKCL